MTTTHRPWNWADRVLAQHADQVYAMDAFYEARRQHEGSRWWWMWKRFETDMEWDNLVAAGRHG